MNIEYGLKGKVNAFFGNGKDFASVKKPTIFRIWLVVLNIFGNFDAVIFVLLYQIPPFTLFI